MTLALSLSTLLPILIGVFLVLAAATVFLLGGSRRRSDTGRLSRETRQRDASADTGDTVETDAADSEAAGTNVEVAATARARADEARRAASGEIVTKPAGTVATYEPIDEEALGVTRRQFFNRSTLMLVGLATAAFGASLIGFLWPSSAGGFGGKIRVGSLDDILGQIEEKKAPVYNPEARTFLNPYPADALPAAEKVYDPALLPGMEAGLVALWQKCPHLGCRVPWCETSQWFECPCHGSKYNRVGEKKGGPAPRGMDRFPIEVTGSDVTVNTGIVIQGPPIGTDTTEQGQEGPSCV
ncbi:MAG: Rieske 2Fe-2S domain-containing protein [Acidimicrobiia bacterium]|nr:Rieske 2Fe-2S domain-containing protein [Acidimicrobiia bacterium]